MFFSIMFQWNQVYQELERQKERFREDIRTLCGLLDGLAVTNNTNIDSVKL